ncbi:MAG: DNA repair protein RadC [Chitinophagales bacterium]
MEKLNHKLAITSWAVEDRPREKLMLKGKQALSDAELLAILIGSGSREETAVDLCKRIMRDMDYNLNELGKKNIEDFIKNYKGIGEAKAISIIAALELGRRRRASIAKERKQIKGSNDAFELLHPKIADLPHEEFWVIFLNRANKITSTERISSGGVAGTVADVKLIFKRALEHTSSGIILAHNHPSGNLRPSQADITLTKKMVEAGKVLEINVLDHVIVTDMGYYSFADEGMI